MDAENSSKIVDLNSLRRIVARYYRGEVPLQILVALMNEDKEMFAVIKTGGKQYKVAKEDVVQVEKLDAKTGSKIAFDNVLMVGDSTSSTFGTPLVEGASVSGTVMEQGREDKILVFKRKRRQGYRRRKGHRQHVTLVKITNIMTKDKKDSPPKKKALVKNKPEGKVTDKKKKTTTKKTSSNKKSAAKRPASGDIIKE